MTSAFSWQTLLAFALLHSVLQGQICLLLQVFLVLGVIGVFQPTNSSEGSLACLTGLSGHM